jgi:hypothetical protein
MPRPRASIGLIASFLLSLFLASCTGGGGHGGGGGGGGGAPSISNVAPSSGAVGALITINGTNFGATQGTSTVTFNGTAATVTSWSATSIVVTVPAGATNGNVVVTVGGVASNGVPFTISGAPSITSLTPNSGPVGTMVTIAGSNFGATQGNSTVLFKGTGVSATVNSWSNTSIVVIVPTGATTGNVTVTVNGALSNGVTFTVTATPSITSLAPNSGPIGTSVVIAGANFGVSQGTSTVTFNGVSAGTASAWSTTSITVTVPIGATSGPVVVSVAGVASNGTTFTVTAAAAPTISSLNPTSGRAGISVTIAGANFGAAQGNNTVTFNGVSAGTASAWSTTSITVTVPTGATTGNVVVTVGGVASNGVPFTVTCSIPVLGNESLLNGTYTALFNGWSDNPVSVTEAAAAFHANGAGGLITNGEIDAGAVAIGVAQGVPVHTTFTGCFNLGTDQRGLVIWNSALGQSITLAFAVRADGSEGRFIEFDDANPSTTPGDRGAGSFEKQAQVTATNAPVAFGLTGYNPNGGGNDYRRSGAVGVFGNIILAAGAMANGTVDVAGTNDGTGTQTNADNVSFTVDIVTSPDSLGRGTLTINFADFPGICGTPPCPLTLNYAYYEAGLANSPGRLFLQSTDLPDNNGHSLDNGEAIPQTSASFGIGSLFPNAIVQMTGADLSPNHAYTDIAVGRIHGDGAGNTTVNLDEVSNGSQGNVGTTAITGGTFAVSANGMGTISFGTTRFFSIAMIGNNAGFILEGTQAHVPSPGHILVGDFQPQAPYGPTGNLNSSIFSGVYAIGDDHPASTSSDNFVGSITANPNAVPSPTFSGKTDSSAGSGCLTNCLAADQAITATYSVDGIGRTTVTFTSGGSGTPVGWARTNTDLDFLNDTTAGTMNGRILKLIQ